ncbi:hypothetical protein [Sphaerisporangium fuscum]|uniref:hypothetical protein n=1 Tax=Sphaerisporangium fuscum TaxID=2835868 RepID=UPI001BDC3041|nr:hypothetical protein [Sphaerisporangium fuscum]
MNTNEQPSGPSGGTSRDERPAATVTNNPVPAAHNAPLRRPYASPPVGEISVSGDLPGLADRPGEPTLYVWTAVDDGGGRGACGVTDGLGTARRRLLDAMGGMYDSGKGAVWQARLDGNTHPYPSYEYGALVLQARRDRDGKITLRDQTGGRGA